VRGLQDHGAPGRKRGGHLPRGEVQREVPRHDRAHHAHRLAQRVRKSVAESVDGLAVDLGGPSAEVAENVGHHGHVHIAGFEDGLAVVESFQLGQFVDVFLDQIADAPQNFAAFAGRHLAPRASEVVESFARRRDGLVNVLRAGFRELREHFAGSRINGVKCFARACCPLPVDEQFAGGNFRFGCGEHCF